MKPDRVPNLSTGNRPDRDDLARDDRLTVDEALKHRLRAALHGNQGTTPRRSPPPAPTAASALAGPPARREPAVRRCGRATKAKRCFPTEAAARARLGEVYGISFSGRGYGAIRVHHCRKCGQWHLTSKTDKPQGRGKHRR